MAGTSVVFSESQALKQLAKEQWNREGDLLVSQNAYTPEAVNQYQEPLTARTREKIGFSTTPDHFGGGAPNTQKLVLNAAAAERFYPRGTLNILSEAQDKGSRSL